MTPTSSKIRTIGFMILGSIATDFAQDAAHVSAKTQEVAKLETGTGQPKLLGLQLSLHELRNQETTHQEAPAYSREEKLIFLLKWLGEGEDPKTGLGEAASTDVCLGLKLMGFLLQHKNFSISETLFIRLAERTPLGLETNEFVLTLGKHDCINMETLIKTTVGYRNNHIKLITWFLDSIGDNALIIEAV
jgi:hypothetical protein